VAAVPSRIELWTDGACSGNPGPGGWAYVLVALDEGGAEVKRVEGHGGADATTNNRMEISAAIHGLRALRGPTTLTVVADSAYVVDAFKKNWIRGWQRNGWKTASKQPVKNPDLWQELIDAAAPHTIKWVRVKGHAHHELNNRCDELAVHERDIHAERIPRGTPPPVSAH
jgi:ribonuclease HI